MIISSRQNDIVRRAASLKQKKNRDIIGEYLVEGEKLVTEAFLTDQYVLAIYATQKYADLAERLAATQIKPPYGSLVDVFILTGKAFEYISDEVTPQGIAATIKINKAPRIERIAPTLLLDRVQDPGNVGALLRLAAATGISDVFLISCADPYSPKVVRASMSGIFRLNLHFTTDQRAVNLFKKNGVSLICADMKGENVFNAEIPQNFCLCVGNEGKGISEYLKNAADKILSIPMKNGVESLNVGIAAGVALYTMMNNLKGV